MAKAPKITQPEPIKILQAAAAEDDKDLEIIGIKTERNDLEDLWMSRVSNLEAQYEEHMKYLQKRLFDHRVDRKIVARLREDNEYMKYKLDSVLKEQKAGEEKLKKISDEKDTKERQVKSVKTKLADALTRKGELTKELHSKNKQLKDSQHKQKQFSTRLNLMEKDRNDQKLITQQLKSTQEELLNSLQTEELQKKRLLFKLNQINTERKVQFDGNLQLFDTTTNLLELIGTKEQQIYQMQSEINKVMRKLNIEKEQEKFILKQQEFVQNELNDAQKELIRAKEQITLEQRNSRHWKEEAGFQEILNKEVELAKSAECSALRGQIAQLKRQIHQIEQKMNTFDVERVRLMKKLEILPKLDKSLQEVTKQNQKRRSRFMPQHQQHAAIFRKQEREFGPKSNFQVSSSISSTSPFDFEQADPFAYFQHQTTKKIAEKVKARPKIHTTSNLTLRYPQLTYEKEIASLQSQLKQLDLQFKECQRKENLARLQLKQKSKLQQELFWREKAMLTLEKENKKMDQITKKVIQDFSKDISKEKSYKDNQKKHNILNYKSKEKQREQKLQGIAILKQIESQQEFIQQLKTQASLPKIKLVETELEKIQLKEFLNMAETELQQNITRIGKEINIIENKAELLRPKITKTAPGTGTSISPELMMKKSKAEEEEKDIIEEHFVPEEELLQTIQQQFSEPGVKFEDISDRSIGSSTSSLNGEVKSSSSSEEKVKPTLVSNVTQSSLHSVAAALGSSEDHYEPPTPNALM